MDGNPAGGGTCGGCTGGEEDSDLHCYFFGSKQVYNQELSFVLSSLE
jgi:hypothetical protein